MHQSWGILTPASLYLNRIDRELIKKWNEKMNGYKILENNLIDIIKEEQANLDIERKKSGCIIL